jgi:protein-disulfide isomerase
VIPDLIAGYVETGKVRFVYREFPLNSIHPNAQKASEAAVCAGEQDHYWEMNELLFETAGEWGQADDPASLLSAYAGQIGLDTNAFQDCMDSGEAAVVVQGDLLAGETLGVSATPYFFVNDLPIRGGLPIESLGRVIDYVAAGGPQPSIIPQGDDPRLRGDRQTARAITVAFVDYANPESANHALEVLPQLMASYVDEGQLLYVLHPWSSEDGSPSAQAAAAAECAGQQDSYWEMHDRLFADQDAWAQAGDAAPLFVGHAEDLGLDTGDFETCLSSDWAQLRVQAGSVVGALYGVPGAPVFLFNNGQGQQGSPSYEEFQTVIDEILNQ